MEWAANRCKVPATLSLAESSDGKLVLVQVRPLALTLGQRRGEWGAKLPMEAVLAQEAPGGGQLQPAVTQQPEEQKVGLLSHLHPSAPWRGQKA